MLIRKPVETLKKFNREEILGEIIEKVKEKYEDYYIVLNKVEPSSPGEFIPIHCGGYSIDKVMAVLPYKEPAPWHLLIVRTVEHEVHKVIGMMHHESKKMRSFQQVFAVRVEQNPLDFVCEDEVFSYCVTKFIITDTVKNVLMALEDDKYL